MNARGSEGGYAVLAAMVAAAGFALVAAQLIATSRGAVVSAGAEAARARLTADAQAGLALAIDGLESPDASSRWALNGDPRTLDFDDAELTIRVEDERGKIPLNTLSPDQARAMFRLAGADPADVETLTQAFLLRRDPHYRPDDEDAPPAAGAPPPRPAAPPPPQAGADGPGGLGFADPRELLLLPGMTAALYAAMAPSVSVNVRDAAFEPRTSTPLALQVMGGAGSPAAIERQREVSGERAALDTAPPLSLAGRPLTIRVDVRDRRGDTLQRANVVELTRAPGRPYVLRLRTADSAASETVTAGAGPSG